jgi:hypothetical protein
MEGTRGSDKLAHLRKTEIAPDDLDRLAGLGDIDGIVLTGWHPRGIPPVTEAISGSFHAQPELAGGLVDKIVATGVAGQLRLFPRGIPAWTLVEVQFASEPELG